MTKRSGISDNWRNEKVEVCTTEILNVDTILPIDSVVNRNPMVFNLRPFPGFVIDTHNIKLNLQFNVKKKTGSTG